MCAQSMTCAYAPQCARGRIYTTIHVGHNYNYIGASLELAVRAAVGSASS